MNLVYAVLLAFLYFLITFFWQCWQLRNFPGPKAIPILGNVLTLDILDINQYWMKLRSKYGKIFTFFIFNKPCLIILEPSVVKAILSDNKTFIKGSDYTHTFKIVFGQGLVTSNGEKHKQDRMCLGQFFNKIKVNQYCTVINQITMDYLKNLTPNKPINIEHHLAVMTFRVLMNFITNENYDANLEKEWKLTQMVSDGSYEIGRMIMYNLPSWSWLPYVRRVSDFIDKTGRSFFHEIIHDERVKNSDNCLRAMQQANMTEEDIFFHFITIVAAGHDTTTYFLAYTLYLLAQNIQIQDKLRDEINQTVGTKIEVNVNDINSMPYLRNVMSESLRFYTVIPNISRVSTRASRIGNINIPADCNIFIPFWVINRDPELWSDPLTFDPDRFTSIKNLYMDSETGYFPFSYGSRGCIGVSLAHLESAIILCHIIRNFELSVVDGQIPKIRGGISLTTKDGIMLSLKPQNITERL